jgi:hypothetical protein
MPQQSDILARLRQAAAARFDVERAAELEAHLIDVARWLDLIEEQPLDLLGEEPDDGR